MGQAKQRGSYEQRVVMAVVRNRQLAESIRNSTNGEAHKALRKFGPQRLATRLAMVGMLYR